MNNDINKNGHQQLEGDKINSSRSTDDINKMMCNLLLHQSAPDVGIDIFKEDTLEYHCFMPVFREAAEKKISESKKGNHKRLPSAATKKGICKS